MFKNYLIIVWRNMLRQPIHAILSLACLTLGISAALFILLYLNFELGYDRFHTNVDRIYRIETQSIETHEKLLDVGWRTTPANLAPIIQQDYPDVDAYARFYTFWQDDFLLFRYGEETFMEEAVLATDASLFDVFSLKLIKGVPQEALKGSDKIVISENLAQRIFGKQDPIGKILTTNMLGNDNHALIVTGVYQELPKNTNLNAEAFISVETDPQLHEYYFNRFNVSTYVLLKENVDSEVLTAKLSNIYDKYLNAEREPVMVRANHILVPLADIHLAETEGYKYLYILSAIGILLLLLAAISYINLVTAQATKRMLEIGIRKVMGSHRKQLIIQFLTESLSHSILAICFSIILILLSLSTINDILGLSLDLNQLDSLPLIAGLLGIMIVLGILGGSYPAFFLSALAPIAVMKDKKAKGIFLRKSLVAIQFAVVILVLTCTAVIYDQLQYLRNKDLGFEKEHIITLSLPDQDNNKNEVFKAALLQNSSIVSATTASFIPGANGMVRGPVSAETVEGSIQKFSRRGRIDQDFFATMGIELILGRNFSSDYPNDSAQSVIVNEQFVKDFNMGNPLGKKVRLGSAGNPNYFMVIGVVKDFHQSSLHSPIEPQMFLSRPSNELSIRIGKELSAGIKHIKKSWTSIFPNTPFLYHFLDNEIEEAYEADQIRGKFFLSLSLLTIFIAFLGLFGLTSYLAKQRTKEIGIRKVLGANVQDIVILMTRNFILLVLIAAIPAFLLSVYIMNQWLENFAFRTDMNYAIFAFILLFALIFTLLTTGFHAVRSAHLNPAKTLKYE